MKVAKTVVVVLVVAFGVAARAAEVVFTGADASNPTNLASAANWTGAALPGAGNVGVIDLSQTPALGYVVSTDMSLAGLKVVNNGSKAVTFNGPATLTLGAGGIVSGAKGTFTFRGPLATSAAQTWAFAESTVTTVATITGTEPLTIDMFNVLTHSVPPAYGGSMTYTNCKYASGSAGIRFKGAGKWAKDVYISSNYPEIKTTAPVAWSTIFPDGNLHQTNWAMAPLFCSDANNLENPLVINDGDELSITASPYQLQILGPVEQKGGSVAFHKDYFMSLGSSEYTSNWRERRDNIRYLMSGGTLSGGTLEIGNYFCGRPGLEVCRFEQTGGAVTLGLNSNSAGGVALAAGGTSTAASQVEYLMTGGSLDVTYGNGNSVGLGLCDPSAAAVSGATPAAFFTQKGGSVSVHRITLGGAKQHWSTTAYAVNDGYGRYDLAGGTLTLRGASDCGLDIRPSWNNNASVSNGVYAFRFTGGTFVPPADVDWPASVCFPKTDVGTVLGSQNRNLSLSAPIWGTGKLVKEGTGSLLLTDASRFTGTLDVRAGTVAMKGATGDVTDEDNCLCWTADSLAATLADGARVENWADASGRAVATTNGCQTVVAKGYSAPVLKTNLYNGHAAVRFNNSGLMVSQAQNPIYGRKSCTVVAVLKPDLDTSRPTGWSLAYDRAFLSVYPSYTESVLVLNAGKQGAGGGRRLWGTSKDSMLGLYSSEGYLMDDGAAHAVVFTIDENRMEVTLDGTYTNITHESTSAIAPIGWYNSTYSGTGRKEIQIGSVLVGSDVSRFNGDILELRIYTNRLFTVAEQRTMTRKLIEKYDGRVSQLAKFESGPTQVAAGTQGAFTDWTSPTPVATAASWDADDIVGEDGAAVESWPSVDGTKLATTTAAGLAAPTLVRNAINGHAALRFSCTDMTGLGVAAADSPVSGAKSFAAAVVWRSERKWTSSSCDHRSDGPGLISSRQATSGSADFTLCYRFDQSVMGGYGHADGDQAFKTCKPSRLDDGEVHISMLSCDGDAKTYKLMTDGVFFEGSLSKVSERGAFDVLIGACRKGGTKSDCFFDGDIAAVRLYGQALTKAQMRDLGEFWAKKYASQLLVGYKYKPQAIRAIGLGATNVTVAAGARLSLPVSDTVPFTMTRGTLSGAGEFLGTYRFASGATFDLSSETPAGFDELNLSGGAIVRLTKATAGAHVRKLTASGNNVIDVTDGLDENVRKTTVLTFDECAVDENATWTVCGASSGATVIVDTVKKQLIVKQKMGAMILVR